MSTNISTPFYNDWKEQLRNALKTKSDLEVFFGHQFPDHQGFFPLLPRALAAKIKKAGSSSALWKQFLPDIKESNVELQKSGHQDPIGDMAKLIAPQIIHRYKNRALFLPTSICPVHCRYCFRRNELQSDHDLFSGQFDLSLQYFKEHTEIEEIIFSGGDPLMLSNQKLDFYLTQFSAISHLHYIRLHTRMITTIAARIDPQLIELLVKTKKNLHQLNLVIHINHTDEIDPEVEHAIELLVQAGIPVLSQTVLLKGINDNQAQLILLFKTLAKLNVRPYYLHHPDQVQGGMHFYVERHTASDLYRSLRQYLPGWALPHYILDSPAGTGKEIAILTP